MQPLGGMSMVYHGFLVSLLTLRVTLGAMLADMSL